MAARFKEFEENSAFGDARSGIGKWGFWDLDKVPWKRRHCG